MKKDLQLFGQPAALALTCSFLAFLLSGCGSTPRVEIQRVSVAVPVACSEPIPDRPVMPTEALRPGATVDQFTQAATAEIERREGYEGQLLAALEACTKPIGKPASDLTRAGA